MYHPYAAEKKKKKGSVPVFPICRSAELNYARISLASAATETHAAVIIAHV